MSTIQVKKGNLIGALMQIPMWIFATLALIQFVSILYYSLTDYNMIDSPTYIGFENYRLLRDEIVVKATFNTVAFYSVSALLVFAFGILPAVYIARLKRWLGVIFCGGYALLTYGTYTNALKYFFSGDSYGVLNSWLLSSGAIVEPVNWTSDKTILPAIVLLTLAAIGPAFIIAYIAAACKKPVIGGAAGVIAALLLMIGADGRLISMFGFPSVDYKVTTLSSVIYDYADVRFEAGIAAALGVFGFILLLHAVALICGIAFLFHIILKKNAEKEKSRKPAVIFAIISAVFVAVMLLPTVINFFNAFKALEEFFTMPVSVIVKRPTFENFSNYFKMITDSWVVRRFEEIYMFIDILKLSTLYLYVILPSAVGFAVIKNNKLKAVFLLSFAVLPFFYKGVYFPLTSDSGRPFATLMPILVFLTGYYITRLFLKRRKGALSLGIPAGIGICFAAAATFVNFSNRYIRGEMNYDSFYQLNSKLQSGGVARAGAVAAGDLLLFAVTVLLFVLPVILLVILSLKKDKTKL